MRPTRSLRDLRRAHVAVGAAIIGIPATAGALSAAEAFAQGSEVLPATIKTSHIRFGRDVVVTGTAPSSDAGQRVELELAPAGQRGWTLLTSSTVRSDGTYRLAAPVRRSGHVRVLDTSPSSTPTAAAASAGSSPRISVSAALWVRRRRINVLGDRPVHIRGKLLPGVAGRKVRLEASGDGGWQTVGVGRTGAGGAFNLRYVPGRPGHQALRVRFAGDRLNSHTGAPVGQITVFHQSVASWYNDAGTTACGFHAYYGVANRNLPCGTHVTFLSGGRSVTATVDDRGPYVGGREWDLNQNTAAALGFGGVGSVWSSQ